MNKPKYVYLNHLILTAKKHQLEEFLFYESRGKQLTAKQLELILLKNGIPLPIDETPRISKKEYTKNTLSNLFQAAALVSAIFAFVLLPGIIQQNTSQVKSIYSQNKISVPSTTDSKDKTKVVYQDQFFTQRDTRNFNTPHARSVLSLFEELEYNLKDIRSGKPVKPVFFTQIPRGINELENINARKELFIQIVLPLILSENQDILIERKKIILLSKSRQITLKDSDWLKTVFKRYQVEFGNFDELLKRADIIPPSLAIAQAAYESGWGTSRFALEGNSLFGQRTWSTAGLVPKERDDNETFKVTKFDIIRASVKAYKTNLNTHKVYKELREERYNMRNQNKVISGLELAKHLDDYSEIKDKYTLFLEKIIEQNSLTDFDKSILLPTEKINLA